MTKENIFVQNFVPQVQKKIIEFVNKINMTSSDYYLVMARKGKCFWDYLCDLELINVNGLVITERCLDMDYSYLTNKSITIVDDVVISGTSIHEVIEKLKIVSPKEIKVCVLGVDEYFNENLFTYIQQGETKNYLIRPFFKMNNSECVNLCSNIVNTFKLIPKAYDVDFPEYKKFLLSDSIFKKVISFFNWEVYDLTSEEQLKNNILILTLIPSHITSYVLNKIIGFDILKYCFVKIRLFINYRAKSKKTYEISLVPYVLFNEIYPNNIEVLFENLISNLGTEKAKKYHMYFPSCKSKTRYIQYVLAMRLAEFWRTQIVNFCDKNISLDLIREKFSSIFPAELWNDLKIFSDMKILFPNVKLDEVDFSVLNKEYDEEIKNYVLHGSDPYSIQARLTEPFIYLYKTKEKQSRQLIKQHGLAAYQFSEYRKIVGRLNIGYSYRFLKYIIRDIKDYDVDKEVSLFIDKAVDSGIIVPVIAEKNGIIFRAYRHGEDIPFGDAEEKACVVLLKNYAMDNRANLLTKFKIEKMLVMLLKINEELHFLKKFITTTPKESSVANISKNVVQVTSYMYGNVLTLHTKEDYQIRTPKSYMDQGGQYKWLSNILIEKKILHKHPSNNTLFKVDDNIELELDKDTRSTVSSIGIVFGELCYNNLIKRTPNLSDWDLVALTSCLNINDIIPALSAEISIFKNAWINKYNYFRHNFKKQKDLKSIKIELLKAHLYKSIESGQKKYEAFVNKEASQIIDRVKLQLSNRLEYNLWEQFWPSNYCWDETGVDPEILNLIYNQGKWLVGQNILINLLLAIICTYLNDKDSIIYINKIKLIKKSIDTNRMDKMTTHILSKTDNVLSLLELDKFNFDYKNYFIDIMEFINFLVQKSVNILDDSELMLNKYSDIHRIIRFSEILFIKSHTDSILLTNDDKDKISMILNKVLNKYCGNELYIIPDNHNVLECGLWVIASGKNANLLLLDFYAEYSRCNKNKFIYCYFSNLNGEYQIKKADMSNTNYRYGLFWEGIQQLLPVINIGKLDPDEIIIINCNHKKSGMFLDIYTKHLEKKCIFPSKVTRDFLIKNDFETSRKYTLWYFKRSIKRKGAPMKVDIAINTILPCETKAIKDLLGTSTKKIISGQSYYFGTLSGKSQEIDVVLASQIKPGNVDSGLMYKNLLQFKPKYIVLFGIAGAISDKLKVNDVVIADSVLYYEKRKEISENIFQHRGEQLPIAKVINNYIQDFRIDYGEVPRFDYISMDGENDSYQVQVGPIGSGEVVFGSDKSNLKKWMEIYNDKVLAVETEGYGITEAYYESSSDKNAKPVLIIRGISDTADNDKGDSFRTSACTNAANVLKLLLEYFE